MEAYFDFVRKIFEALKLEVNGSVRYKAYPNADSVIFSVKFKDFMYEYPVTGIQTKMLDTSVADIIEELKADYKRVLINTFIKTDKRKERDKQYKEANHG